jgi:hypothetical protein
MFYFWYKSLVERINKQNSLDMKITFSVALSIFSSIGLTAVSANELMQPIDNHQRRSIPKPSHQSSIPQSGGYANESTTITSGRLLFETLRERQRINPS